MKLGGEISFSILKHKLKVVVNPIFSINKHIAVHIVLSTYFIIIQKFKNLNLADLQGDSRAPLMDNIQNRPSLCSWSLFTRVYT